MGNVRSPALSQIVQLDELTLFHIGSSFHVFTVNKFRARIQIKGLYLNCVGSLAIV